MRLHARHCLEERKPAHLRAGVLEIALSGCCLMMPSVGPGSRLAGPGGAAGEPAAIPGLSAHLCRRFYFRGRALLIRGDVVPSPQAREKPPWGFDMLRANCSVLRAKRPGSVPVAEGVPSGALAQMWRPRELIQGLC